MRRAQTSHRVISYQSDRAAARLSLGQLTAGQLFTVQLLNKIPWPVFFREPFICYNHFL